MSDESELQARIAAVAGQINHYKQKQNAPPPHFNSFSRPSHRPRGAPHWTPYGSRGGRAAFAGVHKNRSLVFGGNHDAAAAQTDDSSLATSAGTSGRSTPVHNGLISSRGCNNQLMTKQTFDRERSLKLERLEKSRDADEQQRAVHNLPPSPPVKTPTKPIRILEIKGIKFEMQEDGSKLIRIPGKRAIGNRGDIRLSGPDPATDELKIERKEEVSGVEFFRTKKGNLVRAVIRDGRYSDPEYSHPDTRSSLHHVRRPTKPTPKAQCELFTKHGTYSIHHHHTGYAIAKTTGFYRARQAGKTPSHVLTLTAGKCPFGPSCKFAHNLDKVAICKDFLYKSCPAGDNCDLSHQSTYERVPACTHYLRGNCTKTACLYPHVNVPFDAPVCRPFATLGFCAKGEKCGDRHVFECPDYANSGRCPSIEKGKCSLPHIDRAGNLRKATQRHSKVSSPNDSDISSDDEEEEEEEAKSGGGAVDSDGSVDIMMGLDDASHELSQQRDFVAFS